MSPVSSRNESVLSHLQPSPRRRPRRLAGLWPRPGLAPRLPGMLALAISAVVALGGVMALGAGTAQAIAIKRLFAGNCKEEACGATKNPSQGEAELQGYRTAGGYVPYGITDFELMSEKQGTVTQPEGGILGSPAALRTDVAPGVVTNPFAPGLPRCSMKEFEGTPIPSENKITHETEFVYTAPTCAANTVIGTNVVLTAVLNEAHTEFITDAQLVGKVYNLEPANGLAAEYGVALNLKPLLGVEVFSHTFVEGNVEWASDYHDYFEIKHIPPGLLSSRFTFFGSQEVKTIEEKAVFGQPGEITKVELQGERKLVRNPTSCNPPGPATTSSLTAFSYGGSVASERYTALVGANECGKESPFAPAMSFLLAPEVTGSDMPDGITTETKAVHPEEATKPDISDLKTATVTLPAGMTMNPSAAAGLEGCTPEQIGIGTRNETACPSRSRIGTVDLEVPTLPAGSLHGPIFLGKPAGKPIEGPPYTIYLDAESARYGVKVRLKGTVTPNPATGQLTTTFAENPEGPFNDLVMHFDGGALAPIANPLTCGAANLKWVLEPFATEMSAATAESPFTTTGCASPQFAAPPLSQSMSALPTTGGSTSNFTLTLTRPEGQQYIGQISTTLPPGVVAKIPSVPLCSEAQGNAGTCPAASLVGNVRVTAGSGTPFSFTGGVYLTEHYEGAPYGLSIVTSSEAGPFNFGPIVTRAKINVNEHTSQVTVTVVKSTVQGVTTSGLPTVVGGIPVRMREMTVTVNRPNYILNPTNCGPLTGASALTSTLGANATVPSSFQAEGCSSLPFKPVFKASTNGQPTRAKGASLKVEITQGPGEANIASSVTTLPLQLPSRQSTLQRACTEEQGAKNIFGCPASSKVGSVTAETPTLPGKMTGPAYIVSQGGHAFPNLDLVLEDQGVRVILVGNTNIKNGITTTTFASNPDVPITSFTLNLPMQSNSLLSFNGSFCKVPLKMPTTLVGQNGKKLTQSTRIAVSNCFPILKRKVRKRFVLITVKTPQAGRVIVSGDKLARTVKRVPRAKRVTIKVPLTKAGRLALRRHRRLKVQVRVHFAPRAPRGVPFTSFATVLFT